MPAPKKPAAKKSAAKKAAKPAAKPAAAKAPQASQPVFKVVASSSKANTQQPEWLTHAIAYAQANPAVTFVAIIAAALGIVLLFS
jgi:hypothetical protein